MAGNYPDVPAPRMAYDRDGSTVFMLSGASVTEFTPAQVASLNNESDSEYNFGTGASYTAGIIFPQLRQITGFYICWLAQAAFSQAIDSFQISSDTTNGYDGTWVNQADPGEVHGSVGPTYRTSIATVSWSNVKGIRFRFTKGDDATPNAHRWRAMHIYGALQDYTNVDQLRVWHPTLDEPLDDIGASDGAYFDWAEATRGTSADKTFRIKNNSATLTANSIVLSPQALTDTSPTVVSQMTLSDGGAFTGSLNIGNLSPGALSSVITLRRTTLSNATLSIWAGRINVNPGSWT